MTRWKNEGQTCTIDGCDKPMRARRWCTMHYHRWRKYGDAEHKTRPHRLDGAVCSVDGCDTPAISKMLCKRHYSRQWKTGTTADLGKRTTDPERRFALDQQQDGQCLTWTGAKTPAGYGALRADGRVTYAHRYAWERTNGPIPVDKMIDHACHNRACVNVDHLRLATAEQNAWNKRGPAATSRTGVRNVSRTPRGTYFIQLHVGGKNYSVHGFSDIEEARIAAENLRVDMFGEFAGRS